ncbi:trans-sialidase [Trypanosoma conorhini]|uniref:Trans-sialidase n=1 Tax=Trypanosoma conorhini TaxID=83891 RepID=A0A422MPL6_9TRYP|nr:trans-sialidase [Trypanosoma conorhini]RNE95176.1 trans-sialidase [Trypanosoma conorhini]
MVEHVQNKRTLTTTAKSARIFDVGPISSKSRFSAASSTLLHTKDKLFLLYERKEVDKQRFVLVRLDDQLERIKEVPAQWEGLDNNSSNSCRSLGAAGACDGSARRIVFFVQCRPRHPLERRVPRRGRSGEWRDEGRGRL